jgi:hypothetical protein
MKTYRTLTLRTAAGAEIRTATFRGHAHVVVPVVALMEGVFWASNAADPEMIYATELAIAPAGWNGRPVVMNHPDLATTNGSANEPQILEAQAFGHIFNTWDRERILQSKQLGMEAWLDEELAERVGHEALDVIRRAQAREPIEISVGVFQRIDDSPGVYNGRKFKGIWRNVVPDHLAMLSQGMLGACSNDRGCGVRAAGARIYTLSANGVQEETVPNEPITVPPVVPPQTRTLKERLLGVLKPKPRALADGISVSDIWSALEQQTRAIEPAFLGVAEVFPEDNEYVYAVNPDDKTVLFRRSYSIDGTTISIAGEKLEVQFVSSYEPVTQAAAAAPAATARAANCGCGGTNPTTAAQGATNMDPAKKARVDALIANTSLPFITEADRAFLEAKDDAGLKLFEAHATQLAAAVQTTATAPPLVTTQAAAVVPPVTPPTANVSVQTTEQYIAAAPPEIQESLREGVRMASERRTAVITALKATGRCDLTDPQLAAYTTPGLEQLLKLAGVGVPQQLVANGINPPHGTVVSFAGRGAPRVASDGNQGVQAPPDMCGEIRTAAQAAGTK